MSAEDALSRVYHAKPYDPAAAAAAAASEVRETALFSILLAPALSSALLAPADSRGDAACPLSTSGGGAATGRRGAQGAAQESAPDGIQGDEVQTEFLFEWDEWRS